MANSTSAVLNNATLGQMILGNNSFNTSTTGRFLIDYLPQYMQEYLEIKSIMETEQPEINALWSACERTLADQYIMDATEYGVMRWEGMLNISPKATDTLDERKFRILARLNTELPYTLTKLKEMLTVLCGAGGFVIDLQANKYHIEIKLAVGNHNNYAEVQKILNTMIPANLTQAVSLLYNPHREIKPFRHMDLRTLSHETIRKEVLPNA